MVNSAVPFLYELKQGESNEPHVKKNNQQLIFQSFQTASDLVKIRWTRNLNNRMKTGYLQWRSSRDRYHRCEREPAEVSERTTRRQPMTATSYFLKFPPITGLVDNRDVRRWTSGPRQTRATTEQRCGAMPSFSPPFFQFSFPGSLYDRPDSYPPFLFSHSKSVSFEIHRGLSDLKFKKIHLFPAIFAISYDILFIGIILQGYVGPETQHSCHLIHSIISRFGLFEIRIATWTFQMALTGSKWLNLLVKSVKQRYIVHDSRFDHSNEFQGRSSRLSDLSSP